MADRVRPFRPRSGPARAAEIPSRLGVHRSRSARPRHQLGRVALALSSSSAISAARLRSPRTSRTGVLRGRWDEAFALLERARDAWLRTGDVVQAASRVRTVPRSSSRRPLHDAEVLLQDAAGVSGGGIPRGTRTHDRVSRSGRGSERVDRGGADAARGGTRRLRRDEGGFEVRQVETFIAEAMGLAGDPDNSVSAAARGHDRRGARAGGEIGLLGPPFYRCSAAALRRKSPTCARVAQAPIERRAEQADLAAGRAAAIVPSSS